MKYRSLILLLFLFLRMNHALSDGFLSPEKKMGSIHGGISYLVRYQKPDGRWEHPQYPTAVTALSALSILGAGHMPDRGPHQDILTKTIDLLLSAQRGKDGLIAIPGEQRSMYGHGFSTLFLSQVYGMTYIATPDTMQDATQDAMQFFQHERVIRKRIYDFELDRLTLKKYGPLLIRDGDKILLMPQLGKSFLVFDLNGMLLEEKPLTKEISSRYEIKSIHELLFAEALCANTKYGFGNNEDLLEEYAWYYENADRQTHSVLDPGIKPIGGLYNMHGNVWEWASDRYDEKYPTGTVIDPDGPPTGSFRVLRGGGWNDDFPDDRYYGLGFRVLRTKK